MPSSLTPKPPTLLRVFESQAISNSSSLISSTSLLSLFERTSGASSGYLTDLSSLCTPSTAEFGKGEGEGVFQPARCVGGPVEPSVKMVIPRPVSVEFPSKPVLGPVTSCLPCSPFILGTPDLGANWKGSSSSLSTFITSGSRGSLVTPDLSAELSANWEGSSSSLFTLMLQSPPSHIPSPANMSFDEEEMARIMRTLISIPTRTRQLFLGSPEGDVDVATVMRVEIASTFRDRPRPHAGQTRTLVGLGVAMPVIYPPLPPTLFPLHHPPGTTLNSRSLRELGYQSFDDKMFEIEQNSLALLSRNVIEPSPPENVDFELAEGEVALPPISDFCLQVQESLNFEPSGVQKTLELDASQLERQSALYNLEHSDLSLDHIFSHSPPIQVEKRTEIERQLLANLFKKKSRQRSKSQRHVDNPSCSSRDDLDVTSPTVTPQDDPRSPNLSMPKRVFLAFSSVTPPSPSPIESQSSGSVRPMDKHGTCLTSEIPSKPNKKQIGLGLPSRVAFRRNSRRQEVSSHGSTDAIRCQSSGSSQECQTPSFIVTAPSFTPSYTSRVQSAESSNQFLKPSRFAQRSLYDIIEVLTPPSSSFSSPRGTPPPRNRWLSPFTRLNAPQKKKSSRSQLSTPSMGSAVTISSDTEVEAVNVDSLPEVPVTPAASARPGFKRFVSKFTRRLFKRSRSSKTSELSSPVLIEHADAPPKLENTLSSSISHQNLQFLF